MPAIIMCIKFLYLYTVYFNNRQNMLEKWKQDKCQKPFYFIILKVPMT